MMYTISIDQFFCAHYGLNLQQGAVYKFCYDLPSWADSIIENENTWYFASRNKALEELPVLSENADTFYRHYKKLQEKGVIFWMKKGGKDYVRLEKSIAKNWNRKNFREENKSKSKSEKISKKASKLEKKFENGSEKFPTNKNTTSLLENHNNKSTKETKVSDTHSKPNSKVDNKQPIDKHSHKPPKEKEKELREKENLKAVEISGDSEPTMLNVIKLFKKLSGKSQVREHIKTNHNYAKTILKCAENNMKLIEGVFKMKIFEWKDNVLMREHIELSTFGRTKNFDKYIDKYLEVEANPIAKAQFIEKVKLETLRFAKKENTQPQINDETFNKALELFEKHIDKKTDIALAYAEYQKYKAEMIAKKPETYNFERVFKISVDMYTKNVREGFWSKEFTPAFHNWIKKRTWLKPPQP